MEFLRPMYPLFLLLMMLGGLVWLIIGLFHTNLVTEIFGGGTVADVIYVVIGLAALFYVPKLFDELSHMGSSDVRPHGA